MHMANNDPPSQGFQVGSSAPVYIKARLDPETGTYCILWRDIQQAFNGVRRVQNGSEVVSFLTDGNLEELQPLRIGCFPGLILQVILDDLVPPPAYTPGVPDGEPGGEANTSSSDRYFWGKVALGTGVVVGGAVAAPLAVVGGIVAAPLLVTGAVAALGFGAGGIIVGTPAAMIMASYGGAVTAGSACAILQSIGAAGLGATGTAIASTVGGAAAAEGVAVATAGGVAAVALASKREGN
ncbi:hypothetical protein BGX34_011122 [Mortierella sp. NVP85]|nr:hypothetical protein BGX34_011122 [Mortierella sp. NVP85]